MAINGIWLNATSQNNYQLKTKTMDMKKELQLIELRAQVSLLYELLHEFSVNNFKYTSLVLTNTLKNKQEQIIELEKQLKN